MTTTWSATWPSHQLTLEEWEALPEDDAFRLELVEGVLSIVPTPLLLHQRATMRLGYRIEDQLCADLTAVVDAEVVIVESH